MLPDALRNKCPRLHSLAKTTQVWTVQAEESGMKYLLAVDLAEGVCRRQAGWGSLLKALPPSPPPPNLPALLMPLTKPWLTVLSYPMLKAEWMTFSHARCLVKLYILQQKATGYKHLELSWTTSVY